MSKSFMRLSVIVGLALSGCVTQTQLLNNSQDMALQTVLTRAKFEMNCPDATGTILSREVVQPAIEGPGFIGIQRAEYTVGVAGCKQRHTYVVVCPEGGESCFATGSGGFLREQP